MIQQSGRSISQWQRLFFEEIPKPHEWDGSHKVSVIQIAWRRLRQISVALSTRVVSWLPKMQRRTSGLHIQNSCKIRLSCPTPAPADVRHAPPEGMLRDFRDSARARVSPTRPPLSHTVGTPLASIGKNKTSHIIGRVSCRRVLDIEGILISATIIFGGAIWQLKRR